MGGSSRKGINLIKLIGKIVIPPLLAGISDITKYERQDARDGITSSQ